MTRYATLKEDTEFVSDIDIWLHDGDPYTTIPAGTIVEVHINEMFGYFCLYCGSITTDPPIPLRDLPHYVDFLE